jgi:hypothetical protein
MLEKQRDIPQCLSDPRQLYRLERIGDREDIRQHEKE